MGSKLTPLEEKLLHALQFHTQKLEIEAIRARLLLLQQKIRGWKQARDKQKKADGVRESSVKGTIR
jgi:hypothetical protein